MIGPDCPTYFVADIAANHDGNLERAKALIVQVAESGGNAVKFQNFQAKTIVSDYGFKNLSGMQSHQSNWKKDVYKVYEDASLPLEWTQILKNTADENGVDYLTAPYDIDLIESLSPFVCAWKLGSGDITWHEEIERLASDGKPFLMATGAANMEEVRLAVEVAQKHCSDLVLMQCNTNYTASLENFRFIALNVLKTYAREFPGVVLGLSDHTPGHVTVLGAIALGARVIEKHFTDDIDRKGPDHKFSMDPASWKEMVLRARDLEAALGIEEKQVMGNEMETVVVQRRAVRSRQLVAAGSVIKEEDLIMLRPCPSDAIPPYRVAEIIGKTAARDIAQGDCFYPNSLK